MHKLTVRPAVRPNKFINVVILFFLNCRNINLRVVAIINIQKFRQLDIPANITECFAQELINQCNKKFCDGYYGYFTFISFERVYDHRVSRPGIRGSELCCW